MPESRLCSHVIGDTALTSNISCLSKTLMKKSHAFVLTIAALVIGIVSTRWCFAQSARQASSATSKSDNYIAFEQLQDFVRYLQDTKQTNTLRKFNDYANVTLASRSSADLGVKLGILHDLHSGRTNEAIHLLELQVTSAVVGFAGSYRELPLSIREKVSLTAFREARDYCTKHPVSDGQGSLKQAFTLLDEKPGR
jgi:hypothetical protein